MHYWTLLLQLLNTAPPGMSLKRKDSERQTDTVILATLGWNVVGGAGRSSTFFLMKSNWSQVSISCFGVFDDERLLGIGPSRCGPSGLLLSHLASPVQVMFYYPRVSAPIQSQAERWSQHGGGRGLSCLRANGKE